MLRKILLAIVAVIVSFSLTALSGYMLYLGSDSRSEAHLSTIVRFILNPAIAIFVGLLVGFLSKDNPSITLVLGVAPWAFALYRASKGAAVFSSAGWLMVVIGYVILGAAAAYLVWRWRQPPLVAEHAVTRKSPE
jgi:hypothetical protein